MIYFKSPVHIFAFSHRRELQLPNTVGKKTSVFLPFINVILLFYSMDSYFLAISKVSRPR
jgi:hypothetical protein